MTTFSIEHERIVRGRTDHDHLMMHWCDAASSHSFRVTNQPIKIRNEMSCSAEGCEVQSLRVILRSPDLPRVSLQ